MPFGLSENTIIRLENVFAEYQQIEKIIIYGSRAKGNYKNGSDIDLTVIGKNIHLTLINKIENEIDDLLLPYTIDISIYNHIKNQELIDHIKRVGVEFYKKDKTVDRQSVVKCVL